MFGAFVCVLGPNRIKTKAPVSPRPIPTPFSTVIRSFRKKAERINSNTGAIVITTELFIGVDRLNPLKNIVMFKTIPKKAHAIMRYQSLLSTFSEV